MAVIIAKDISDLLVLYSICFIPKEQYSMLCAYVCFIHFALFRRNNILYHVLVFWNKVNSFPSVVCWYIAEISCNNLLMLIADNDRDQSGVERNLNNCFLWKGSETICMSKPRIILLLRFLEARKASLNLSYGFVLCCFIVYMCYSAAFLELNTWHESFFFLFFSV